MSLPLPPGAPSGGRIDEWVASDGRRLRFRTVSADREQTRILYFHGIESHGTWFLPVAAELARLGISSVLFDRRGSGLNRDDHPGDTAGADRLLADVRELRALLSPTPPHFVGLSWGGKYALAAALDQPRGLRSLTLITPGLKARVDVPIAAKLRLLTSLAFGGHARIKVPITPEMFTLTPSYLEFIRSDPGRLSKVTARFLWASRRLDRLVKDRIANLALPVLLVLAEQETIVDNEGILRVLSLVPQAQMTVLRYPEARHSVQFDQRDTLVSDLADFLHRTPA